MIVLSKNKQRGIRIIDLDGASEKQKKNLAAECLKDIEFDPTLDKKELLDYMELYNLYIQLAEISANEQAKIEGGYACEYMTYSPSYFLAELLSLLKGEKNIEEMITECKDNIHVEISLYDDMEQDENDFYDLILNLIEDKKRFDSMEIKEIQEIISRFVNEYFGENYILLWSK